MKPFKIAHISDLHINIKNPDIFTYPEHKDISFQNLSHTEKKIKSFISLIKQKRADFIAVTGDLIDAAGDSQKETEKYITGEPSWKKKLKEYYNYLKDILDNSCVPYSVIPGNHDHNQSLLETFPQKQFKKSEICINSFIDNWDKEQAPLRENITEWIKMLKDNSKPVQVYLQHYVIHPQINADYPYNYINNIKMKDIILKETGNNTILLCLSGHYHPGTELLKINNSWFTTVPAFYKPPHYFRIYTIADINIIMDQFTAG